MAKLQPGQAFLADERAHPTPDFDRLMDTAGFTAAEARRMLGETALSPQQITVAPSIREKARQADHEQYVKEFGLTGDWSQLPADQQATNAAGLAQVRQALESAHQPK